MRKSPREIGDIIFEVIQKEGTSVFTTILRKRATNARRLPSAVKSLASSAFVQLGATYREIRQQGFREVSKNKIALTYANTRYGLQKARQMPSNVKSSFAKAKGHYQTLPTTSERTEFVLMMALYSASYLGGVYLGYQLPHRNVKLFHRARPQNLLTLYSAPLIAVEIALEWLKTILQKTMAHPQVTDEDRKALSSAEKIFVNLSGGVATGVAAGDLQRGLLGGKKAAKNLSVNVALNDNAYKLVEEMFTSLTGDAAKKSVQ